MPKLLDNISLRLKISIIIWIVSILAVVIGLSIYLYININDYKHNLSAQTITDANILSDYCALPIEFKDSERALDIIDKLKSNPLFNNAIIYDKSGAVFVKNSKSTLEYLPSDITQYQEIQFIDKYLVAVKPIRIETQTLGYLCIVLNSNLNVIISKNIRIAFYVIIFIIVFTFLLAYYFQTFISSPIINLKQKLEQVSDSMDYSVVMKYGIHDEIGALYSQVNSLLTVIKQREIDLVAAKNRAEESDNLKSAFLANLSHEIRTPMNGILGFANLLNDNNLSIEKRRSYIETINSSSSQLLAIINDIVEISKIETKQLSVFTENVNINKIIDMVMARFTVQKAKVKNHEFIVKKTLPDHLAIINTDSVKVQQILTNLIENALKYSDSGTIQIEYSVLPDNFLEFYVKDDGEGIEDKFQTIIFDRFRQVSVSKLGVKSGMGLGLSITKAYVEILGGTMRLKSALGKGSTFYFTLPFISKMRSIENLNEYDSSVDFSADLADKTIIVAEDDITNFQFISEILERADARLIHAHDGLEAVNLFNSVPNVFLIIMDIKMPNMDGIEATKNIRMVNKSIPIIALTAFATEADKHQAIMAGCSDFITKPVNKSELLKTISRYLS